MFPRMIRSTLFLGLTAATALAACSVDIGQSVGLSTPSQNCQECQTILVDCTSTSKDENQFVECRDQFQECQATKNLQAGQCGKPKDASACKMCRSRLEECNNTASDTSVCAPQFSVCKAFLISRSDVQQSCTETETVDPVVACGVCGNDFATCLSDITVENPMQVCGDKFDLCRTSNSLTAEQCEKPADNEACNLCRDVHAQCVAASNPSCQQGFDACSSVGAPDVTCALNTGAGGGGEGGSGEGGSGEGGSGGGGSTDTCEHDTCAEGDALTDGCNTCATLVCQADAYCCMYGYDEQCVDIAKGISECGC